MTTQAELEAAYNATLAGHAPVASAGQANDAFEVYVLSLALRAANAEQATIHFEAVSGSLSPSKLQFRTAPGRIYSRTNDYTHARIDFGNGLSYEAHIGIYVSGKAGVLHECDLVILETAEADFCRRTRVHPKHTSVLLMSECKFYTGKLGISIGREFLGVTADLGKDGRFLLSNSDGRSAARVLAHHGRQSHFGLTPLNSDIEGLAVGLFRGVFRNAIAKRR